MQLSEKDKQALQEKYKAQRQAMWSGKQSTSQDSEEKTPETDQTASVESSGETSEDATDSTDARSSNSQTTANQPSSTEAPDQATAQSESNVQPESGAEAGASVSGASDSSTMQNIDHGGKASQSPAVTETSVTPAESNSIAENTEGQEEEEQAGGGERVFWEALEQEGGPSTLTWKLVLAVISIAIILIGVGVYLGFLFAS